MSRRIRNRRGTAANWTSVNPVLGSGEIGVETDANPRKFKIGDGSTAWASLPYAARNLTIAQNLTESEKVVAQKNIFNVFTPVGADHRNLFIGDEAGNTTMTTSPVPDGYRGSGNYGIGNGVLRLVTTGYRNVAFGNECMRYVTTGYHNTGMGHGVLQEMTTGQYNSAFGIGSMNQNTTGSNNSGYGGDTLYSNTTGSRNDAHGRNALFLNTTGSDNCAFGYESLYSNLTGDANSGFGPASLGACTTGDRNAAFGVAALRQVTTGNTNTGIGDNAGATITTGSTNICIGLNAGSGLTTGSNNVCIGGATMNASDSGHVVIADGLGNRRLSFDSSGVGTFPGVVVFDTVTRFGAPLRDTAGANRIRFVTGAETEITSGGLSLTGLDVNGSIVYDISAARAYFGGTMVCRLEASETLTGNRQMVFEAVSDTQVRIKYRGTDGTTRVSSAFSLS